MRRIPVAHLLAALLVIALVAVLPMAGGCAKDEETPDTPAADDAGTDAPSAATSTDGSGAGSGPNTPSTITVRLYWVEAGENAIGIERTLPYSEAVATAALNALIAGPTVQEKSTWPSISNAIPAGTQLLGVTVADGLAKVNLSKEFESGGGTFSVTARLAQVVYTLEQFPTVEAVEFYLEGAKVEVFSTEGLILDGPQTSDDYYNLLPVDA